MHNGSMQDFHKLFQIPMNYQCILPLHVLRDQNNSVDFSPFLAKLLFCMGSPVSTEWQNLAQQLHTFDGSALLLLHRGRRGR